MKIFTFIKTMRNLGVGIDASRKVADGSFLMMVMWTILRIVTMVIVVILRMATILFVVILMVVT